jgi:hypothetical protein
VPLAPGAVQFNLPFDTIGTNFSLIVGIFNDQHFSGNSGLPAGFPKVDLTSLTSFDVDYSNTIHVSASLPEGVSLTSASGEFPSSPLLSQPPRL